jgi:hypothetical protein
MIGEMAEMDLVNQGLKKMVPILIKAVGSFTTLQSNITMLVRFFDVRPFILLHEVGSTSFTF